MLRALTGQVSGSVRLESREEIEAKFHDNAQRTLSAQRAGEPLRAIDSLEQLEDAGALVRLAAG